MKDVTKLSQSDRDFIDILRGASVLRVVLMHLGLAWFYPPYSNYIGILFPILFFVSGAVSYYSFCRSKLKRTYILKRFLSIALPFYVFMLPAAIVFNYSGFELSVEFIIRWLLLTPPYNLFPFPIGQIWFISCLLILAIFSFPLFMLQNIFRFTLLATLFLLAFFSFITTYEFLESLNYSMPSYFSMYILFESLALSQFFIFGAVYIRYKEFFVAKWLVVTGLAILLVSLSVDVYSRLSLNLEFSELRPNIYIYQSFGILLVVLGLQKEIMSGFNYFEVARKFVLYCNTHAYSIFILHIPILIFIEESFQWQDLSERPIIALIRLLLVVSLSLLFASPLSWIHKNLTRYLNKYLL